MRFGATSYVICFAMSNRQFMYYRELDDPDKWDMVNKDRDATHFPTPERAAECAKLAKLPPHVIAVAGG